MLKKYSFHPFSFAVLPVVYLYGNNIEYVSFSEVFFPIIINLGIVTISLFLFLKLTNNKQQAAIESSIIISLFSTFGHTFYLAYTKQLLSDNRTFIIYVALFIAFTWTNFRLIKNHLPVTEFLNTVSVVLLVFSFVNIVPYWLKRETTIQSPTTIQIETPATLPDIYYLILDGYGGDEMLSEVYHYNNNEFITELENKGFYVASGSFANYVRTVQSLNSTLNIHYLENDVDWPTNIGSINNNYINDQFQDFGYNVYTNQNQFNTTNWAESATIDKITHVTPFFWQYVNTTALILFWDSVPHDIHRQQILKHFNSIENIVAMEGPKFVFAHIISPHPPFVFDKDGNSIQNDRPFSIADADDLELPVREYQAQYIDQLIFINSKISKTINFILANSSTPPIIIIQGDHGPGSMLDNYDFENNSCLYERFSILNAYYFPDGNYNQLHESISPVNTFRVILDQYFDIPYDLLEDKAYFSVNTNYNKKIDVTNSIKSKFCNPSP